MKQNRPALFRGRHFEPEVIVTCVRWYLRFSLSLRNVEELMTERGLIVDHTTVWRWCQTYGPVVYQRLKGNVKYKTTTWHMDETYVRVGAGGCICSVPLTVIATLSISIYRKRGIVKLPRHFCRRLYPTRTIDLHVCCVWMGSRIYPAAIRELQAEGKLNPCCRRRTQRYANNRIESDHRNVKRRLRAMQGPRTFRTARRVIQGIEAVHMIRKGQILGSIRTNLATPSIAFALLLGID